MLNNPVVLLFLVGIVSGLILGYFTGRAMADDDIRSLESELTLKKEHNQHLKARVDMLKKQNVKLCDKLKCGNDVNFPN